MKKLISMTRESVFAARAAAITGLVAAVAVTPGVSNAYSGAALYQIPTNPLPTVETASFPSGSGDVADDSAVYADPVDPSRSVVIADNKASAGGVGVFDMQGRLLQFRQDGKIGNIDLRPGFTLNGQQVVLVGANNRTNNTLIFWVFDPVTRQLSAPVSASIPTIDHNYGFTMYHSAVTGKFYAFVTQETGSSTMQQYELFDNGNGQVGATLVRSFAVGSITEGCVADDDLGYLYVGQEDVALWKYGAEPGAGSTRTQVGRVGDGHLTADIEGMSLAYGPNNTGYLVVSSQGNSTFAVYDRQTNAFQRSFKVNGTKTIDGTTGTDGLDITTANMGPGFTKGVLVVHDGYNTNGTTSNLKYVPLI